MMAAPEWFSCAELAALALPDLPGTPANIIAKAKREAWDAAERKGTWWRDRSGRGGGIEYHLCVLPLAAQAKLAVDQSASSRKKSDPIRTPDHTDRAEMWAWFERQTETKKFVASERLSALDAVRKLTDIGVAKTVAARQVAELRKVALSSLYAWEKMTHRVPRSDWMPYLAPRHAGSTGARVEFSPEAWEALKADWLRPSQPTEQDCYRRLKRDAALHGWTIPSLKTCSRRLKNDIPEAVTVLMRKGPEALENLFPAQRRDRSGLRALQVINADFHTWDVRVAYPGGVITRPVMSTFQDIYSGKVLAWRLDLNPTRDGVRLCMGEVIERYGVPSEIILDNGREYASKEITGGQLARNRFKVKAEDPIGLFTQLGVTVHWATPYHGQAKPIERAFRDMAQGLAKDPRFEGAYTGNSTSTKPSNYGTKAVPFDLFRQVVAEGIAEHNARLGRTGGVCRGRSFDQVFAESYAVSTIRKGTAEQRRLWLLAAESIKTSSVRGEIELLGNRFWHEDLIETRGMRVTVRFDPMNVQAGIHVYRQDGAYLCEAPCIADVGFISRDGAREHGRTKRAFIVASKAVAKLQVSMSLPQRVELLAQLPDEPEPPETKIVRPLFGQGNTARQLAPEDDLAEQSDAEVAFVNAWRKGPLTAVENGND